MSAPLLDPTGSNTGKVMVTARIYKPGKTAMQSAKARIKEWVLDYEPEEPREIEPLMGWTASGDMRQQVRLRSIWRRKRLPTEASQDRHR